MYFLKPVLILELWNDISNCLAALHVSDGYLKLPMTKIELLIKQNFHLGKWYLFLIPLFASLSTSHRAITLVSYTSKIQTEFSLGPQLLLHYKSPSSLTLTTVSFLTNPHTSHYILVQFLPSS